MADYSNIPLGLKITTQIPLDVKSYVADENTLKDLGSGNNLAFTYYKGAIFYCAAEGTRYQWREVVGSEVGLMSSHYTYPANVVAFGITYSNKTYNFFPILISGQLNSDWNSESGVTKILNKPTIPSIAGLATTTYVDAQDALKVDKVTGSRLITSAESIILGNTSGTNTGNNAVNTLYSGLEASKQDKITLTNNNSSGSATLIDGILNIPVYSNSQTLQSVTSNGNTTSIPIKYINGTSTILKAVLGDSTKGLFIEMDNSATGIDILNNDATGTTPFIYKKYNPDTELYTTFTELDNDGNLSSSSFIKIGGTSSQYLMADGNTSTMPTLQQVTTAGNTITLSTSTLKGIDITLPAVPTVYQNGIYINIPAQTSITSGNASPDAFFAKINGQNPGTLDGYLGGYVADVSGADNYAFVAELKTDALQSVGFYSKSFDSHTGNHFLAVRSVGSTLTDVFKVDNDGDTTAKSFIKAGGSLNEYLMANGSTSLTTSKENSANKQNSLAVDGTGTKFPTVDAVNAGISSANYWTKTGNDIYNNNSAFVGIGTTVPLTQFNVNQTVGASTNKGITITGDEIYQSGVGTSTEGVRLALGVNRAGNRQLWIGDNSAFGSSTKSVFRYSTGGNGWAGVDAVTGDGITRSLVVLGSDTGKVSVGYDSSLAPTPSNHTAKLNVFTYNETTPSLIIKKWGTATGNFIEAIGSSDVSTLILANNGLMTLPSVTNALIEADTTGKAVVTKEYFTVFGSGGGNTGVGTSVLSVTTTGYNNTAIGNSTLMSNTIGYQNTALGFWTLKNNISGDTNTGVGYRALYLNTIGSGNTGVGNNSLENNDSGLNNTAIGLNAMNLNTTASNNTSVGFGSLSNNLIGGANTAIGYNSLLNNTATQNTAIGLNSSGLNVSGIGNFSGGYNALYANTSGSYNVSIGHNSARYIADGTTNNSISDNSIFIGTDVKAFASNQTNQIVIGYNAVGAGSNTATLGNDSITSTILKGLVKAPLTTNALIEADATGKALVTKEYVGLAASFTATGTATTTFTVTIGTTQANNTYKVVASPSNALSAVMFYINNKTTTTFDVVFVTALTGAVAFDWILKP